MLLEFSECNKYIWTNKEQCCLIRTAIPYTLGFLCCRHLAKLCFFCGCWNDLCASCFFCNEFLFFQDSRKVSSAFLSKPSHLELGILSPQFPGFHGISLLPLPVIYILVSLLGFPGDSVDKESACSGNTGNAGSIPGFGRFPGVGHGNQPKDSCLWNPMERGAWVAKSRTQLNTHTHCSHNAYGDARYFTCNYLKETGNLLKVMVRCYVAF